MVAGSNPVGRKLFYGPLAQLVEQQTLNLWVAGSKPAWLIPIAFQTEGDFFYLDNEKKSIEPIKNAQGEGGRPLALRVKLTVKPKKAQPQVRPFDSPCAFFESFNRYFCAFLLTLF